MREATEVGTTHLGAPGPPGVPWWVVPPSGHPQVLLWPILDVLQSFYRNFISFFGTNLLTQCPVPVAVFACFLHRRKSISNGVQTPRNFLWNFCGRENSRWARAAPGVPLGGHNPPGRAWGPRHTQVGCAHLGGLPHPLFTL